MSLHFHREIEGIKKKMLALSAIVEEGLRTAIRSIMTDDRGLAEQVIANDTEIDAMEIAIEEECLKILALYQPVAGDLRFIVSVLKMNNDLERIGDLATNIAEHAFEISDAKPVRIPPELSTMTDKAAAMVKMSLDALVEQDAAQAQRVCIIDDEVDELNRLLSRRVKDEIRAHPENLDPMLALLGVARHLERVADHATNIAEDVVYLVQGTIIRHGGKEVCSGQGK
ncbi:MAG: phosphate signaling complex protein PhoU [Bacteroidota bacterium]|nr:phosphate signaling complex protein PhoU [Bacteroidota bacterium]